MAHLLSKSKYIRGLQCDRALWLDVHNPRLAKYTREQMLRFDRGREFEYAFKATFPNGIDISAELKRNVDAYPERTAQLLDRLHTPSPLRGTLPNLGGELKNVTVDNNLGSSPNSGEQRLTRLEVTDSPSKLEGVPEGRGRVSKVEEYEPIVLFEAGFLYDDVLVLADVVKQNPDGTLDIYEVKSGTALSETYCRDAALQHYVISHCREIHTFSIVYANPAGGFITEDLTDALQARHDEIEKNIAAMKAIALSTNEPDTPSGQHCLEPYGCPYQSHCQSGVRQLALF